MARSYVLVRTGGLIHTPLGARFMGNPDCRSRGAGKGVSGARAARSWVEPLALTGLNRRRVRLRMRVSRYAPAERCRDSEIRGALAQLAAPVDKA